MKHDIKDSLKIASDHYGKIFVSSEDRIIEFVKKLEGIQYSTLKEEIINHFDLISNEVQGIDQSLTGLVHMNVSHDKELEVMFKESNLSEDIVGNMKVFLRSLPKKSTDLLNFFYLADLQTREKNSIKGIGHRMFFELIHDDEGALLGQVPMVHLKLFSEDDDDLAEFKIKVDDLNKISDIFNKVSDTCVKSLKEFKESSYTNRMI